MSISISDIQKVVSRLAEQHGIESVSLFGSYARGAATAGSDIDLKIEKGQVRSLFQLSSFRLDVEDALKLPVDLVTSDASDRAFLNTIAKDEVLLYRKS